jgi:hypothetical protein
VGSDQSREDTFAEIRAIERRLGALEARLEKHDGWSGTFKIVAGSVATIAGIALAPPTGGLTAFIAGLGAILWADGFREDAVLDNERRRQVPREKICGDAFGNSRKSWTNRILNQKTGSSSGARRRAPKALRWLVST